MYFYTREKNFPTKFFQKFWQTYIYTTTNKIDSSFTLFIGHLSRERIYAALSNHIETDHYTLFLQDNEDEGRL